MSREKPKDVMLLVAKRNLEEILERLSPESEPAVKRARGPVNPRPKLVTARTEGTKP